MNESNDWKLSVEGRLRRLEYTAYGLLAIAGGEVGIPILAGLL